MSHWLKENCLTVLKKKKKRSTWNMSHLISIIYCNTQRTNLIEIFSVKKNLKKSFLLSLFFFIVLFDYTNKIDIYFVFTFLLISSKNESIDNKKTHESISWSRQVVQMNLRMNRKLLRQFHHQLKHWLQHRSGWNEHELSVL